MTIRITDLPQETPKDGSSLLGVVNGKASLVPTSEFLKKDEKATIASSLMDDEGNVITANEVMTKNSVASDSDKLGGIDAEQFATKKDVEVATGKAVNYTWASPIAWFSATKMPDLLAPTSATDKTGSVYAICNGQMLLKSDYPELAKLLCNNDGTSIFTDENGLQPSDDSYFFLPNLCGKFIAGANYGGVTPTESAFVYETRSDGVAAVIKKVGISAEVGVQGGTYTENLKSKTQIPTHNHPVSSNGNYPYSLVSASASTNPVEVNSMGSSSTYASEGNTVSGNLTGNQGEDEPNSFSIIPHHTTFCYIMRLVP